jgi:hypothetical protein
MFAGCRKFLPLFLSDCAALLLHVLVVFVEICLVWLCFVSVIYLSKDCVLILCLVLLVKGVNFKE